MIVAEPVRATVVPVMVKASGAVGLPLTVKVSVPVSPLTVTAPSSD